MTLIQTSTHMIFGQDQLCIQRLNIGPIDNPRVQAPLGTEARPRRTNTKNRSDLKEIAMGKAAAR